MEPLQLHNLSSLLKGPGLLMSCVNIYGDNCPQRGTHQEYCQVTMCSRFLQLQCHVYLICFTLILNQFSIQALQRSFWEVWMCDRLARKVQGVPLMLSPDVRRSLG